MIFYNLCMIDKHSGMTNIKNDRKPLVMKGRKELPCKEKCTVLGIMDELGNC
jgi:hypothetical protein